MRTWVSFPDPVAWRYITITQYRWILTSLYSHCILISHPQASRRGKWNIKDGQPRGTKSIQSCCLTSIGTYIDVHPHTNCFLISQFYTNIYGVYHPLCAAFSSTPTLRRPGPGMLGAATGFTPSTGWALIIRTWDPTIGTAGKWILSVHHISLTGLHGGDSVLLVQQTRQKFHPWLFVII